MKTLPDAAIAQLAGRRPIIGGAARFRFTQTWRFFSGVGEIEIDSERFKGIAARALIVPVNSQIGGAADGLTVTLSGLDPDVAQSIEAEDYHQKPATFWRPIFDADGHTMLGNQVFLRGRVDFITITETVGGEATIDIAVEGPRRDMNRSGSRIRSNSDQRVLGGASDGSMKHVSTAGKKTLSWGQRPVNAAAALNNGGKAGLIIPGGAEFF